MPKNLRILITGGGSGGHIMPLLTVAKQLETVAKNVQILYIGSGNVLEKQLVQKTALKYQMIATGKLRRYFDWQNFVDFFRFLKGFGQALHLIGKFQPQVIFSKGGYVSLPVCLAGYLRGVPIVLHESDRVMGLANRLIAGLAKRIGMTFDLSPKKNKFKYVLTGSPVRKDLLKGKVKNALQKLKFISTKPVVLIMGGSQGAQFLNDLVYASLEKLLEKVQIIHICGKGKQKLIKKVGYMNFEYVNEDLGDYYALADLIVSRAGANALAEITALQKPSLIVPLPSAANDHQQKNADFFLEKSAAAVCKQKDLTSEVFIQKILTLLTDKTIQKTMQTNLKELYFPKATEQIADLVLEVALKKRA